MATVYILYSIAIDKFYTGSCKDFESRFKQHRENHFTSGFTKRATDWIPYFLIKNLNYEQARKIEKHIKKMKSKTYIQNLKEYPKIAQKLKIKYP